MAKEHPGSVQAQGSGSGNVITTDRFTALQQELEERSRQQTAVAELGAAALTRIDVSTLIGEACALVVETLRVDYARVLEYLPAEKEMVVRALVGHTGPRETNEIDSEAMYAFASEEAVDFHDLASETRFDGAPVLNRLGVTSGVSVRLPGKPEPFGVIGAYSVAPRHFRSYEREFLQSVANVLGAAIDNRRMHEALAKSRDALLEQEKVAGIGGWSWSRGLRDWIWSDGLYALLGANPASVAPSYASFLAAVHPADRQAFTALMERAFSKAGEHELDHRIVSAQANVRIVRTSVNAIFGGDGKPLRIVGSTRDITPVAESQERQAQLAALIELAAQEWRMTCDVVDSLLIVTDATATILRLNERGRKLIGKPFKEIVGRPVPASGEFWVTIRELVTVAAETHLAASGTWHDERSGATWEIAARPVAVGKGSDERVIVVGRDVTDIERREEVRRHGDAVEAVNHIINEVLRLGRPPLQKIVAAVEEHKNAGTVPDASAMLASTTQLTKVFSDLGELAKPLRLDIEPGQIEPVVRQELEAIARIPSAKRIRIQTQFESGLPKVLVNRARLERLVRDLVLLFIDRAPSGGEVRIAIGAEDWAGTPCVRLTITAPRHIFAKEEILWSIDDGLPRLDSPIALQLSVDRRLAEEHGAVLTLANRAADGTSVAVVRFPALTIGR